METKLEITNGKVTIYLTPENVFEEDIIDKAKGRWTIDPSIRCRDLGYGEKDRAIVLHLVEDRS